jgi:hypothetical protein
VPAAVSIGTSSHSTPALLPLDPEFIKKLDRYGYLDARYAEAKHWLDERDKLEAAIQEQYQDHPADQPVHVEGALYSVDLAIRKNQQKITDKAKAFRALRAKMGIAPLIEALTFTLKLLDAHIPKEKQTFVTTDRTGPRTISSAIKSAPQAA